MWTMRLILSQHKDLDNCMRHAQTHPAKDNQITTHHNLSLHTCTCCAQTHTEHDCSGGKKKCDAGQA